MTGWTEVNSTWSCYFEVNKRYIPYQGAALFTSNAQWIMISVQLILSGEIAKKLSPDSSKSAFDAEPLVRN